MEELRSLWGDSAMFEGVGEIDDDDDGLESGEGEDEAPHRILRPVPQSALVGAARMSRAPHRSHRVAGFIRSPYTDRMARCGLWMLASIYDRPLSTSVGGLEQGVQDIRQKGRSPPALMSEPRVYTSEAHLAAKHRAWAVGVDE